MFGKKRQQARPNLPAEPVEEPHGRYYLQSIDTKFISGGPGRMLKRSSLPGKTLAEK